MRDVRRAVHAESDAIRELSDGRILVSDNSRSESCALWLRTCGRIAVRMIGNIGTLVPVSTGQPESCTRYHMIPRSSSTHLSARGAGRSFYGDSTRGDLAA